VLWIKAESISIGRLELPFIIIFMCVDPDLNFNFKINIKKTDNWENAVKPLLPLSNTEYSDV